MIIKFIFTADWHLSKYSNDPIELHSGLPERLYSIKKVLYNISKYAIDNDITHIVVGGDLLHNKSIIHALAMDVLLDFFRDHQKLQFIVVDGNHDKGDKKGDLSALKSLDYEPNVTRISKPTKIGDIFFVPYSYDMIDTIKNNSSDYLVSHFGLNEAQLSSGISIIADIGISDLVGKYKNVLLGHYHLNQEIIKDNIKLYYAGSVIELDYGERNEEKRFLVVNTDSDTIESIKTEGYKKHYNLEITNENRLDILNMARELKKQGHHIQISQTEDMDVSDIREEFKVTNKVIRDVTNRGISSSMSTRDKFKKYLEIKGIQENQMEEYLKIGFEIVNDCDND